METYVESLVERANRAESEGDLETALVAWKLVTESEMSPDFFRRYGRVAQKLGHWQEAENAYSVTLALDPGSLLGLELMGDLWARRDDKDPMYSLAVARDWFVRALNLQKTSRLYTELGSVESALDNNEAAVRAFEEAIALNVNNEEALCNLALLQEATEPAQAIELLNRAVEKDPEYGRAHQALGRLFQRSSDPIRSEYHFRRSLEIDPADYWSTLYLANLLAVLDHNAEATAVFERALFLDATNEAGYDLYANFLENIGNREKAVEIRNRFKDIRSSGQAGK